MKEHTGRQIKKPPEEDGSRGSSLGFGDGSVGVLLLLKAKFGTRCSMGMQVTLNHNDRLHLQTVHAQISVSGPIRCIM